MKKIALVIVLIFTLILPVSAADLPFNDVSKEKWYYPYIEQIYEENIMTGTSENAFEPSKPMSRGMLATVLYRMAGSPEIVYSSHFNDVPEGKYYSNAIIWCYTMGVVKGTSTTTFEPSRNVTRQEVAIMLRNFASCIYGVTVLDQADLTGYSDYTSVSNYAVEAMQWAVNNQLISGDQGKLNPKGNATRAQCAKMILAANALISSKKTYTNTHTLTGCIDTLGVNDGILTVNGWGFDWDTVSSSLEIRIFVGDTLVCTAIADVKRDDVNQVYNILGSHGFNTKTKVSYHDQQKVSVYGVDPMSQKEVLLSAKTVDFSVIANSLASKNYRVIVLDAGHGGNDSGCVNGNIYEKNITLTYVLKIGKILENNGYTVIYTRTNDSIMSTDSYKMSDGRVVTNDLRSRAELGEKYNAGLFVSIHVDSASSTAYGYSVYVHKGHQDSEDLGNYILAELNKVGYTRSKGIFDGSSLRVIRLNTTISVLVELGYISGDLNVLLDANYQNTISQAIATGIMKKANAAILEPNVVLTKQPDLY